MTHSAPALPSCYTSLIEQLKGTVTARRRAQRAVVSELRDCPEYRTCAAPSTGRLTCSSLAQ